MVELYFFTKIYSNPTKLSAIKLQPTLFFPDENMNGGAVEIPVCAYLVFEESLVRLFHPLGQVAKESEGRDGIAR